MNAQATEHFCISKSCEVSTTKDGDFYDCYQKKDSRETSKSSALMDYQYNDWSHAQKKIDHSHQADQVNFATPSVRRAIPQNQNSNSQFQVSYQHMSSSSHQNDLLSYPSQIHQHYGTPASLFNSNLLHQQATMSCLDRFSIVKSNKFPDTPPDSGSEPYSPPNNASMNLMDLPYFQNKNSLPSSSTSDDHSTQAYNIKTFHPNLGSSYTHYLKPQPAAHMPPRHLSCSFPRTPFGMCGTMEFSKFGHSSDCNEGEDSGHIHNSHQSLKKRKCQDLCQDNVGHVSHGISFPIKHEPPPSDFHYANFQTDGSEDEYACDAAMFQDGSYHVITWSSYQQNKWTPLVDENGRDVTLISYRVDADKGFNFALPDESFVCQKKNHFQITVHIKVSLKPKFVRSPESNNVLENIDSFYLHFYGIKAESPNQTIKIEQSQSDRSKKVFNPIQIDLMPEDMNKVTVGRLHFSETTLNNMRKKGKPNPDQRYFQLVVALEAHCSSNVFVIAAHISDKIIVRASNPGQFENDVEAIWNKGKGSDVVYHTGRVGINTDNPDEALAVHGSIRVTGHVLSPSDVRTKTNIEELDTFEQLRNISQLNVYKYHFNEEFAEYAGLSDEEKIGAGVLAQEVYRVLPDAVRETGDIILKNGQIIKKFLVVNKERIFMENVGAVKELCKVTDNLEYRINEMESMKKKLANYCKSKLGSTWSSSSQSSVVSGSSNSLKKSVGSILESKSYQQKHHLGLHTDLNRGTAICAQVNSTTSSPSSTSPLSTCNLGLNHTMHLVIISLVIIMAACLVSITTLYIIDRHLSSQQTQQLVMSLQTISNRSSFYKPLPSMPSKPKYFVPPICLTNQNECPIVCCEMPPNNPSGEFIGTNFAMSTGQPHPWWSDYKPSSKIWKKSYYKFNDIQLIYAKPRKVLYNRTKPEEVNYFKFVQKQHENKHPRLKRDVQDAMIQINVPQMNSTLGQEFCITQDCKDMRGSNFSFSVPLSSRYPLAFITLQFMPSAIGEYVNIEFCSEVKYKSCEEQRNESIFNTKKVGLFTWDLPVGFFFNSYYSFRASSSEMEDLCVLPVLAQGRTFTIYNFNFYRLCN